MLRLSCSPDDGITAVIQDVEPTRQRLTGFLKLFHYHDALAVLTLDESKPVTVSLPIPRNFLTSDLEIFHQLVQERFYWKYGLGYPLPLTDRDSTDCTALFQDDRQCAGSLLRLRLLTNCFETGLCKKRKGFIINLRRSSNLSVLRYPQHVALELRGNARRPNDSDLQNPKKRPSENVTVIGAGCSSYRGWPPCM